MTISEIILNPDYIVDARNHPCPMPILMLKRRLKTIDKHQQIILVKSTDPHSKEDLQHFCQIQGLKILKTVFKDDEFQYYIEN